VQVSVVTEEGECRLSVLQLDLLQGCLDDILNNGLVHVFHAWSSHLFARVAIALLGSLSLQWFCMLSGDDNSVDLLWLHRAVCLLQVLNGDLSLAIRAQTTSGHSCAHL